MWFDDGVVEAVVQGVPTWLALGFLVVSFLGSIYVVAPGVVWGYLAGDRRKTATWPGIVIGAYALFVTTKPAVSIDRPAVDPPVTQAELPGVLVYLFDLGVAFSTDSFPSGHAVAVTVFWGLFVLDTDLGNRRQRLAGASLVVILVGCSRIVLGVHYPADVLAGVALGATFLAVMVWVRSRVRRAPEVCIAVGAAIATTATVTGRPLEAGMLLGAAAVALLGVRLTRRDSPWVDTGADRTSTRS